MPDAAFEKIGGAEKQLYGSRKLLLCGFPAEAQPKFKRVLEMAGLGDVAQVWAGEADGRIPMGALFKRPHDSGFGASSSLPRAIVVSGTTEGDLLRLMAVCRQSGMKNALWAVLTPTSEQWPLERLIAELDAERRQLQGGS